MTPLLIGIVLIVGGIAFAAAPFFRRENRGNAGNEEEGALAPPHPGDALESAAGRPSSQGSASATSPRPDVATAMEELEFDRAMGKMSENDYQELRAALERSATAAPPAPPDTADVFLASVSDTPSTVPPSSSALPVAAASPVGDFTDEAERLVDALRTHAVRCADCGPRPEPDAAYCSNCGMALAACPHCGHPIAQAGARFCDRCGTALTH